MSPTITCGCHSKLCTRSPYRRDGDCPGPIRFPLISNARCLSSPGPRRLWQHRKRLKSARSCTTIKFQKDQHHVLRSISASVATRCIKPFNGAWPTCSINKFGNCRYAHVIYCSKTASSEESSPPLSNSSAIFSSKDSTSSPPSSLSSGPASPILQRRPPRIQVSSLLADPHTRTYHLEVIQHPISTAAFETANLSRLPLTPPIIVQLTVRDTSGNAVVPQSELPFLVAHLSLFSSDGSRLDMGSAIGRGHTPPTLYGNLVSSVEQLEDLQGNPGLFFLFADVSIRWCGQYQLGISLLRLYRSDPVEGVSILPQGETLAETRTHVFSVVDRSEYTAAPVTRLTQCFLRQGARMFNYMPHP